MAQITVEELYYGEGNGQKYGGILNLVMKELMTYSPPIGYKDRTWLELLIVKHTLMVAEKLKTEGDFVLGLSDTKPLSCFVESEHGNP